jgi:serine/threonine protein kinase
VPFEPKQPSFDRLCVQYAERRRPIVFWVGSGLSVNAGLPTWPQLKVALVNAALDAATTLGTEEGKRAEARIEGARAEPNPWEAFRTLKHVMGDAEYYASIRSIFDKSASVEPPDMYSILWSLKISGIISLNIDGFAHRAFPSLRTEDLQIFHGREAKNYVQAISQGRRFVANLHGLKENTSTWVFTKDELNGLTSDAAYLAFMNFIFSSQTVVFVGISADDTAAGGFLENLNAIGLDVGPHFWITDRVDAQTQAWAARNAVQVIRYVPERDRYNKLNHDIPLGELFETLRGYVSLEKVPLAVVPAVNAAPSRISPSDLRQKGDDDTRYILASYARDILDRNQNDTTSADYRDFLKTYHSSIHQSWHITDYEGDNKFFGYTVVERISASAFSNVWRLMDDAGANFALKVIQIDNLRSGTQLESFRRGVQSMSYLTNADVPGTPRLVGAHEIPTCVIMTYVEGHDLQGIVKRSAFNFWSEGTRIIVNVCKSLQFGHNLPQGVLHRDVRPSNIMVPDYNFTDLQAADHKIDRCGTVLLNYDMSWHVSAKGNTIAGNLEESGFYAPEMLNGIQENTARRTSVDAYGVGMTLYFMYTKALPPSGGSKSTDWANLLNSSFRPNKSLTWHSAPVRLRRIIEAATQPEEDNRISVGIIGKRIEMMLRAVQGRFDDVSTDFWAEELLCRAFSYRDYKSNSDESEFNHEPIPGRLVSIKANFKSNSLEMRFENASTGAADRGAGKTWGDRLNSARDILRASGWKVNSETGYRALNLVLSATIEVEEVRADIAKAAKNLDRAIEQVRVD